MKYEVGNWVKIVNERFDTEGVKVGDTGVIKLIDDNDHDLCYKVTSEDWEDDWWFSEEDIALAFRKKEDVLIEIQKTKDWLIVLENKLKEFD